MDGQTGFRSSYLAQKQARQRQLLRRLRGGNAHLACVAECYGYFAAAYGTCCLVLFVIALIGQMHVDAGLFGFIGFPILAAIYAAVRFITRRLPEQENRPRRQETARIGARQPRWPVYQENGSRAAMASLPLQAGPDRIRLSGAGPAVERSVRGGSSDA
ncbi:MAG: hypothetical protein ACOCXJ_02655 [Planctomycetota bacterium]